MQVNSTFYTTASTQVNKSGNNLPSIKADKADEPPKSLSIRELAQSIDPANMSRNEARAMADALMKSGDADISNVFLLHSMVLVPNGDGTLRNATESDPSVHQRHP